MASKKKNTGKIGSEKTLNNSEMKTSEIRDLIEFIAQTGLNEVDIETQELKIHVKRERDQNIVGGSAQMMAAPLSMPQAAAPAAPAAPKAEKAAPAGKATADIKSPMIGTFYRSSNPDSPPFVSVGDKI